jgi:hypothetical protein
VFPKRIADRPFIVLTETKSGMFPKRIELLVSAKRSVFTLVGLAHRDDEPLADKGLRGSPYSQHGIL